MSSNNTITNRWHLYDRIIQGIPADVLVKRACLGANWTYVEAECGMGVAMTCGGGRRSAKRDSIVGKPLVEVAAMAKSWNFHEATLGVAAMNAWYSRKVFLDGLGALYDGDGDQPEDHVRPTDAFEYYGDQMAGKKVAVVGHFPHVERIAAQRGGNLTVLERNCSHDNDTPDPACEYIIPEQDFLFMTGVTLINKTMTRLLELSRMGGRTRTILVGPSVVPAPALVDEGVECLAGSVVSDPEALRELVEQGSGQLFGRALQMYVAYAN